MISPEIGIITDLEVEWSTFSHVSMLVIDTMKVKLLVITLMPFVSELFVSTANVLEPVTSRLVSRGSVEVNISRFPSLLHSSVLEFSIVQVQVTVSPRHTDCLSQTTEVAATIVLNNIIITKNICKMSHTC